MGFSVLPYILESNPHLVFAAFLNEKKLVHQLYHFFQNPALDRESNPHLVFATFLNEKKLVRASNPHLSFNRPLPTGRLFE
jgi:hypothetical protein